MRAWVGHNLCWPVYSLRLFLRSTVAVNAETHAFEEKLLPYSKPEDRDLIRPVFSCLNAVLCKVETKLALET